MQIYKNKSTTSVKRIMPKANTVNTKKELIE